MTCFLYMNRTIFERNILVFTASHRFFFHVHLCEEGGMNMYSDVGS